MINGGLRGLLKKNCSLYLRLEQTQNFSKGCRRIRKIMWNLFGRTSFSIQKEKKEKRETHILIDPNEEITEEVESPIPFREAKTFLDSYQEAEDDSDSDYEEIVCDVIVFQGTPYLLDRCTHEVYSKEDGNPHVGNYNAEEESIEFLKS